MDTSTNGQVKGGPTNKPVNSRPIASRNVKTASPAQSPKTAKDSPRPATIKIAGPPSKSASAKVTPGAKEATNAKSSTVRTATASPSKPRTATQKDPSSPVKPLASQITRQQTKDKGTPQSPLLKLSKTEVGKKSVEGIHPGRPKADGGNSTTTKQNGAAKKDVGRVTQHGIVPKDKTMCLQPEISGSGTTKPLTPSSSPTKPVRMPLTLNKPAKSVPAPDKPVNTSPLPAKAVKIKSSSPKLANTSSPTAKAIKTASPLVKTPRLTSVTAKASTPPTSAVNSMNVSSPAKTGKTPLIKPVNATSMSSQVKLAKQPATMTKQPSVLNKPTNRSSVTSKSVTATGKPGNEKRPVPKPLKSGVTQRVTEPQKQDGSEMNVNIVELVQAQAEQIDTCPLALVNESKAPENIVESTEGLLADAQATVEPCTLSTEMPAKSSLVDSEMQKSGSLDVSLRDLNNHSTKEEVHSSEENAVSTSDEDRSTLAEQKTSIPEVNTIELSHDALNPSLEPTEEYLKSVSPLEEGIRSPLNCLQDETCSPLELSETRVQTTSPLEEEVKCPVEPLQDELSSPLDFSEMSMDQRNLSEKKSEAPVVVLQEESIEPLKEVVETPVKPLEESLTCPPDSVSSLNDKVPIPEEILAEEVPTPVKLTKPLHLEETSSSETAILSKAEWYNPEEHAQDSKEEVELLEKTTSNDNKGTAFEEEHECLQKPLEEEIYSPVEHAEPSEEVQTSSLEQVTPLEEGVELSEDEVGFVDETNKTLNEKGSASLRHSEEPIMFPADLCKPLEIQVTSSMEEVTPSDEEIELSKADEILQDKRTCSEHPDREDSNYSVDLNKATEELTATSVEEAENLQEQNKTAREHNQLSAILPGESAKQMFDDEAEPAGNVGQNLESIKCVAGEIIFSEEKFPSNSRVMLAEPVSYLEDIKGPRDEAGQFTKGQLISENDVEDVDTQTIKLFNSAKEQEETAIFESFVANYPANSLTEPGGYDLGEQGQGNNTTNQDLHQFPGELLIETMPDEAESNDNPIDLKVFEEVADMVSKSVEEPIGSHITKEKHLDSAENETDYMCSPINPEQPGLNTVLFPEEPLTSLKQSEMALLETASDLVEAPKTSLEQLKCANRAEEAMASSICELMESPGDLVIASVTAVCQAAAKTASQFIECPEGAELGPEHSISTTNSLPSHQGNVLFESAEQNTLMEAANKFEPPEEGPYICMQEPLDLVTQQPSGEVQVFAEQKELSNLLSMPVIGQKEPIDLITMRIVEEKEPIHLIAMPVVEEKEPIDLIAMPVVEEKEPIDLIAMPVVEQIEAIDLISVPGEEQRKTIDLIAMPAVEEKEPIDLIALPVEEEKEPSNLISVPVEEEMEPKELKAMHVEEERETINITMTVEEEKELVDLTSVPVEEEKEPIDTIMPVEEEKHSNDLIPKPVVEQSKHTYLITMGACYTTEDPFADLVTDKQEALEPFAHTKESELPLKLLAKAESSDVLHPAEATWSFSTNNTDFDDSPAIIKTSSEPVSLPVDDHLRQQNTHTTDYLLEQTVNPAEATAVTAETITFSHECIKGTIQAVSDESQHEVNDKPDLLICPTKTVDVWASSQKPENEQWVLVEKEELADFQVEGEDKPQRPASLNQEGDNQEEPKAEEEAGERASVCSTLSDPQLAGKSSSETSTPEELRTYEDSSSGVESHSDDVATSPQTTLTPDPDLGIHMGQEEGSDTPAGTPASKSKGAPHPLQNASLEELSEGTSLSGVIKTSDSEIAHKMEVTGFTCPQVSSVSREERYEETAEERGPLRGNDD